MIGGAFGMYPNLWNMPPATITSFETIVLGGAYSYAGMASFADHLSHDDVAAIKSFIVDDMVEKRRGGEDVGAHSRATAH
jgi:quinohemoprotein ethanol dehydrogenase